MRLFRPFMEITFEKYLYTDRLMGARRGIVGRVRYPAG